MKKRYIFLLLSLFYFTPCISQNNENDTLPYQPTNIERNQGVKKDVFPYVYTIKINPESKSSYNQVAFQIKGYAGLFTCLHGFAKTSPNIKNYQVYDIKNWKGESITKDIEDKIIKVKRIDKDNDLVFIPINNFNKKKGLELGEILDEKNFYYYSLKGNEGEISAFELNKGVNIVKKYKDILNEKPNTNKKSIIEWNNDILFIDQELPKGASGAPITYSNAPFKLVAMVSQFEEGEIATIAIIPDTSKNKLKPIEEIEDNELEWFYNEYNNNIHLDKTCLSKSETKPPELPLKGKYKKHYIGSTPNGGYDTVKYTLQRLIAPHYVPSNESSRNYRKKKFRYYSMKRAVKTCDFLEKLNFHNDKKIKNNLIDIDLEYFYTLITLDVNYLPKDKKHIKNNRYVSLAEKFRKEYPHISQLIKVYHYYYKEKDSRLLIDNIQELYTRLNTTYTCLTKQEQVVIKEAKFRKKVNDIYNLVGSKYNNDDTKLVRDGEPDVTKKWNEEKNSQQHKYDSLVSIGDSYYAENQYDTAYIYYKEASKQTGNINALNKSKNVNKEKLMQDLPTIIETAFTKQKWFVENSFTIPNITIERRETSQKNTFNFEITYGKKDESFIVESKYDNFPLGKYKYFAGNKAIEIIDYTFSAIDSLLANVKFDCKVEYVGHADGAKFVGKLDYKNEFGNISEQDSLCIYNDYSTSSIVKYSEIKDNNQQLAFLRAYGALYELNKNRLFHNKTIQPTVGICIKEHKEKGGQYRYVEISLTITILE